MPDRQQQGRTETSAPIEEEATPDPDVERDDQDKARNLSRLTLARHIPKSRGDAQGQKRFHEHVRGLVAGGKLTRATIIRLTWKARSLLTTVDLRGADLSGVDLDGVDLSNVLLSPVQPSDDTTQPSEQQGVESQGGPQPDGGPPPSFANPPKQQQQPGGPPPGFANQPQQQQQRPGGPPPGFANQPQQQQQQPGGPPPGFANQPQQQQQQPGGPPPGFANQPQQQQQQPGGPPPGFANQQPPTSSASWQEPLAFAANCVSGGQIAYGMSWAHRAMEKCNDASELARLMKHSDWLRLERHPAELANVLLRWLGLQRSDEQKVLVASCGKRLQPGEPRFQLVAGLSAGSRAERDTAFDRAFGLANLHDNEDLIDGLMSIFSGQEDYYMPSIEASEKGAKKLFREQKRLDDTESPEQIFGESIGIFGQFDETKELESQYTQQGDHVEDWKTFREGKSQGGARAVWRHDIQPDARPKGWESMTLEQKKAHAPTTKGLDEKGRQRYRLDVEAGKQKDSSTGGRKRFRWAKTGAWMDTKPMRSLSPGAVGGRAIFVMSQDGQIYSADMTQEYLDGGAAQGMNANATIFHHSSFLSGEPVAAAGELEFADGKLVAMADSSGHYRPSAAQTVNLFKKLIAAGVDCSEVMISIFALKEKGLDPIPVDLLVQHNGDVDAIARAMENRETGRIQDAGGIGSPQARLSAMHQEWTDKGTKTPAACLLIFDACLDAGNSLLAKYYLADALTQWWSERQLAMVLRHPLISNDAANWGQTLLELARERFQTNPWSAATTAEAATHLRPVADTFICAGRAWEAAGETERASTCYRQALQHNPSPKEASDTRQFLAALGVVI